MVADSTTNVHASGMPDTPVEVLTDLLSKAAKEENVEQLKLLVQRAHKLVAGLDPYLEECSTPPSDVSFFGALGSILFGDTIQFTDQIIILACLSYGQQCSCCK